VLKPDFMYVTFALIRDKRMLQPAKGLVVYAILHQGYSSQLANAFRSLLINVSCKTYLFNLYSALSS
jgi:hypothetical protein